MIQSIFLISSLGDVFLERHWKKVITRNALDVFYEAQSKANSPEDIMPVLSGGTFYIIHIFKHNIYFVAVVQGEIPPLFVIEFLHRMTGIFTEYLHECTEQKIREKTVLIYEILEEMVDNGFPLATEPNLLKELIQPTNIVTDVIHNITGKETMASHLPASQISSMPWRRSGVKYVNNEFYMDITEEIDCIVDKSGGVVSCDIIGYVDCVCKLSGMPDLTLTFMNPRILEDVSFHPCARYRRWESERIISFVPPDGSFRLMTYQVSSQCCTTLCLPIYVTPIFTLRESSGRMELRAGTKNTVGKTLEEVEVICPMPREVANVNLVSTSGSFSFDPVTRVVRWRVGKLLPGKMANLAGSVSLQPGSFARARPEVSVHFSLPLHAASGLKVNRLEMHSEDFKPYKGVKYITKSGTFQVRS